LFKRLPRTVTKIVLVGGGEPLLYPNILKLIALIKKNKYSGELITNGVYLNDKIINCLIYYKWDKIRISLHAADQRLYQKVHRAKDFNIVLKNIRDILKKRKKQIVPKISLLCVIKKIILTA